MARRLHTDGQPAYRRRRRLIYGGSAGLLMLTLGLSVYVTHQAYQTERSEWWVGLVATAGVAAMAIYLAISWRSSGAR